jgi:hypothetical protein
VKTRPRWPCYTDTAKPVLSIVEGMAEPQRKDTARMAVLQRHGQRFDRLTVPSKVEGDGRATAF